MKNSSLYILILVLAILLTGCRGEEDAQPAIDVTPSLQSAVSNPTRVPYIFKTSEPGYVSVRGMLWVLNPLSMLPDPNDPIYLVPLAQGDQAVSDLPSIKSEVVYQAQVDERTGEFLFINIKPGQYAVIVLEKSGSEVPARMLKSDSIAIVTLGESDIDQIVDLGYLRFP